MIFDNSPQAVNVWGWGCSKTVQKPLLSHRNKLQAKIFVPQRGIPMKIQLPKELLEWLYEKSEKEKKSPSNIIRDILYDEYDKDKENEL